MKLYIKSILFLLLTLSSTHLYAQLQGQPPALAGQALIDSLLKELPKQKEDTNKVNILYGLSYAYGVSNPDEGIKYGQQGLELAAKLDWKKGMAGADLCLGTNYQSKSDNPKALAYFNEALKVFEELDHKKGIAQVLGYIGNVYDSQGDYPKALEYDFKSLKMQEEIGNKYGAAGITGNIGIVYEEQGDYPKALEYDFKALKMFQEIGNKYGEASVTGNIGVIYQNQGDYPKALGYNFKALKIDEETGDKYGAASVTGNIGNVYSNQHNYIEAVAWHFKGLQMCKEMGDKNNEASTLANIGDDYIGIATYEGSPAGAVTPRGTTVAELGPMPYRPDSLIPKGKPALLHKAITFLNKAIAIDQETGSLDQLQQSYHSLSTADSLLGDISGAYYAHVKYTLFKDSIFSKQNIDKIAKLENGRKQYGDSLKADAAKRTADIKAQHRRNYELIGAGVIVLLLGFTFIVTRNNKLLDKEKKRSDNLLLNILPEEVASQLKDTGAAAAKRFDEVTVLFTDFVNFTEAGERMKPEALIDELHTCFKAFDDITTKHSVEKIKTIGDAYLAVAGLPTADPKHAENVVLAAIEINSFMQDRLAKLGNSTFEIRIGIHSGSVVAGIVGVKKFAYDIWGDTVNTAARMEQNSESGKINISQTTYELVKDKFACEYRGEISVKGKGMMKMYYVS